MTKTIYISWDGQSNPVTVNSTATAQQIIQNPAVKARFGLPDACIAVYNGIQGYEGNVPDGSTISVISRPANKA